MRLGSPLEQREREDRLRPAAAQALTAACNHYNSVATSDHAKYSHITGDERNKVRSSSCDDSLNTELLIGPKDGRQGVNSCCGISRSQGCYTSQTWGVTSLVDVSPASQLLLHEEAFKAFCKIWWTHIYKLATVLSGKAISHFEL